MDVAGTGSQVSQGRRQELTEGVSSRLGVPRGIFFGFHSAHFSDFETRSAIISLSCAARSHLTDSFYND